MLNKGGTVLEQCRSMDTPRSAERVLPNPGSTHLRNSRREQPEFISVPVRLGACVAPEGRVCPAHFSTHHHAARATCLATPKVHLHMPALAHPLAKPRSFRHPSRSGATRLGDGRVAVAPRGTHTGSFPLKEFKIKEPTCRRRGCGSAVRWGRSQGMPTCARTKASSPRSLIQPAQVWRRRAMGKIHREATPSDPAQVQRLLQPESIPCQPYRRMSSRSAPQSWRPRSKLSKGRWRR